jgi:hypothetical protein
MHCPTLDEVTDEVISALPRGRAWQNNDGGPYPGAEIGFNPGAFDGDAFATVQRDPSWLWNYWRAFAVALQFFKQRMCDLRQEFWCQSIVEARDGWMKEYGLPDACDPFPDLCQKVQAVGGTRCDYYAQVAAQSGWSISCIELISFCGSRAGCSRAGRARAGRTMGIAELRIVVFLNESTALANVGRNLPPLAGRFRAGRRHSCGPDLTPLKCIMARIVHAHVQTTFEVNEQ